MNLLAYAHDGTEAIIQLENGLPYYYKFGLNNTTYTLITDVSETVDPLQWQTDFPDGNEFDTLLELKRYLARKAVIVVPATPHPLGFDDE